MIDQEHVNTHPDIILLTVDALRTDGLQSWEGRVKELYLDKLASESIVYTNHYSVATSSLMALYSWYSGISPHHMPIRNLETANLPTGKGLTLGEILRTVGYSMLNTMEVRCGDPTIFPSNWDDRNYRHEPIFELFDNPPFHSHFPGQPDYHLFGIASEAVEYSIEWFRKTPPPRFLHVWITDLHVSHRHPGFRKVAGLREPYPLGLYENPIVDRYYSILADIDVHIERLISVVRDTSSQLAVIVGSDHGEALGEKKAYNNDAEWFSNDGRQYDHGYPRQLEETLIHTPLMIQMPSTRTGLRIDSLVSSVDLYATLLTIAGADRDLWTSSIEGNMVLPGIGGDKKSHGRTHVLSHTRWPTEKDRSSAIVTSDHWKLIKHPDGIKNLFFLPEDNHERKDLWGKANRGNDLLDRLLSIEARSHEFLSSQEPWIRVTS